MNRRPLEDGLGLLCDPLATLLRAWRERGEVASLSVPGRRVFLVAHPREIRRVLAGQDVLYRRDPWHARQLSEVSGRGLTASEGGLWREQRRLLRAELVAERVGAMYQTAAATADAMTSRWRAAAARGETVDLGAELPRVALEIVGSCLFGRDLRRDSEAIVSDAAVVLGHMYARMRLGTPLLGETLKPRTRRFVAARAALYRRARRWLDERSSEALACDRLEGDMLDVLCARDDRSLAADQIVTMILAGHDTTGAALVWACGLLAEDAGIAARAQRDALAAGWRERSGGLPPAPGPYVRGLFAETLRLYPPAWVLSRTPACDDVLGGVRIPAGSLVLVSPFVTHRHPDLYDDPERFDAERWAVTAERDPADRTSAYGYLAYGAGPRACVGRRLAQMTGHIVLSAIASSFHLTAVTPSAGARAGVTLRPRVAPRVRLTPL